jgi:hypothetical protein
MGTSAQDRPDAKALERLGGGDTRRAVHSARDLLEKALAVLRASDPARAALIDAALAGRLAAMAEALPSWQPRRPPGYTGGPPSAADLIAVYEAARTETPHTQGRQHHAR